MEDPPLYITTWLISTTLYGDGTCSVFISGSKVLHQILYTIVQSLMLSVKVPCQLHTKNLSYQDDIWSVIACTQLNQNSRISSLHSWQIWKKNVKKNLEDMDECKYFFPSVFFWVRILSSMYCGIIYTCTCTKLTWQNCNAFFLTRIVMHYFFYQNCNAFFNQNCNAIFFNQHCNAIFV